MDGKKHYLVAIIIQFMYGGMYVISKAAFDSGMSSYVFVFYRQAFPAVFLVPLSIVLGRGRAPPLSFMVLFKIFMHAFVGITLNLNLFNAGLNYASATEGSAVANSIPVITFVLAVLLRIETFKLKSSSGMAKILGLGFSFAGVMTLTFYKGPRLSAWSHHHSFGHEPFRSQRKWMKGSFLMLSSNSAFAIWIVLQGRLLEEYPSKLLFTTFQCIFSMVQSFVVAIVFDRDFARWKLRLDMNFIAVAYAGTVVSGVSYYLQAWCIEKKGPVFLATWIPLSAMFTVVASFFFLDEILHLGSVLGGVLIVVGLYSVLWGKTRENTRPKHFIEPENVCVEGKHITSSPTV